MSPRILVRHLGINTSIKKKLPPNHFHIKNKQIKHSLVYYDMDIIQLSTIRRYIISSVIWPWIKPSEFDLKVRWYCNAFHLFNNQTVLMMKSMGMIFNRSYRTAGSWTRICMTMSSINIVDIPTFTYVDVVVIESFWMCVVKGAIKSCNQK